MRLAVRALAVLSLLAALPASLVLAQERIAIPDGDGGLLQAVLFRPDGPGPFPAVVALHGCGGLGNAAMPLSARHKDWGEQLSRQGFMVVFPDSFGSRGLGSQCLIRDRTVRPSKERVADAFAVKAWLQQRSDIAVDRVSLMGWSNGAASVLWSAARNKSPRDPQPDFNTAVALYPGCRSLLQSAQRLDWENRLPLLILIGEADTWTPAAPCRDLVKLMRERGRQAAMIAYPNAVHEFDHPHRRPTKRTGLAFTGDETGEAMVATDPEARADALKRVPAFLGRRPDSEVPTP